MVDETPFDENMMKVKTVGKRVQLDGDKDEDFTDTLRLTQTVVIQEGSVPSGRPGHSQESVLLQHIYRPRV